MMRHFSPYIILALFFMVSGKLFADEASLNNSILVPIEIRWNEILSQVVEDNGAVNYRAVIKHKDKLDELVSWYAKVKPAALSNAQKKALYLNIFNSVVLRNLLISAASRDISTESRSFTQMQANEIFAVGKEKRHQHYLFHLGDKNISLDALYHKLIRRKNPADELKSWALDKPDSRMHAVLCLGAMSSPPLRKIAFTEDNVEMWLEESMKEWVSSENALSLATGKKYSLNQIFKWYYNDFDRRRRDGKEDIGAGDYLAKYLKSDALHFDAKKSFLTKSFNKQSDFSLNLNQAFDFHFDWRINDVRNFQSSKM